MATTSGTSAIDSLHNTIDKFRSESTNNFSEMISGQHKLIDVSTAQFDLLKDSQDKAYEESRNSLKKPAIAALATSGAAGVAGKAKPKGGKEKKGGIFSKALGSLGALAGIGISLAGLGALFAGGGYLIKQLSEFDGAAVKKNILLLLSIPSSIPGDSTPEKALLVLGTAGTLGVIAAGLIAFSAGAFFVGGVHKLFGGEWVQDTVDGVTALVGMLDITTGKDLLIQLANIFASTGALIGIGIGLGTFALGKGLISAVNFFTKNKGFAEKTKEEVEVLLGIGSGSEFGEGFWAKLGRIFGATGSLGLIGAGLAVYSVGKAAAKGAEWFAGNTGFAQKVKDEVQVLLGIGKGQAADFGWFPVKMAFLLGGLLLFSIGKGVGSLVDVASTTITKGINWWTDDNQKDFATKIKSQVKTLLSIPNLPGAAGANLLDFGITMGAILGGLLAFSLGLGVVGITSAAAEGLSLWTTDTGMADNVYNNVEKLLSVTDLADGKDIGSFLGIMASLSVGLLAFGGTTAFASLGLAIGRIFTFFTGEKSPFTQIEIIAENAEKLDKGAKAIDSIQDALRKFSDLNFKGSKIGMEDFAEDLIKSVPIIEKAVGGGKIGAYWSTLLPGTQNYEFKGLANPDIGFEQAAINITILKRALAGIGDVNMGAVEKDSGGGGSVINNYNSVSNNGYSQGNAGGNDSGVRLTVTPTIASQTKGDRYDLWGVNMD